MTIHHAHILAPGQMAGLEKVVLLGLKGLIQGGQSPECIVIYDSRCPEYGKIFKEKLDQLGVKSLVVNSKGRFDLATVRELRILLKSRKWSLIHCHGYKAVLYSFAAFHRYRVPLLATNHGDTSHTFQVKIYEWLQRLVFRFLTKVIVVSSKQKEHLEKLGLDNSKLILIENMLPIPPPKNIRVDTDSDKLKLVAIGRLSPEKGLSDLIDAISLLNDPNVHLSIVGDGIDRDRLQKQVRELNLTDQIKFEGFQENIEPFLVDSHGLIAPSHKEAMPLNLIEAACFGKPIIASNIGINDTLVHSMRNGLLVPPNSPIKLARAIEVFSKEKEALTQIAQDMANQFRSRFSLDFWVRQTTREYRDAING